MGTILNCGCCEVDVADTCDHRLKVDFPWWERDFGNVDNLECTLKWIDEKVGLAEIMKCRYCDFRRPLKLRAFTNLKEPLTPAK